MGRIDFRTPGEYIRHPLGGEKCPTMTPKICSNAASTSLPKKTFLEGENTEYITPEPYRDFLSRWTT